MPGLKFIHRGLMLKTADLVRLFGLSAIWGASFLFMRIIVPVLGVLPTSFFRVLLSSTGLLVILFLMKFRLQFNGKFKSLLLLGTISSGIPVVMYNIAALYLPAGYSAIFNATTPLMGIVIGSLFFSEKFTLIKLLGVLFGLSGVAVLTRTGPMVMDGQLLLGALACLLATSCYGLAGFLTKRWVSDLGGLDSKLVALGSQLGATALILPPFLFSVATNTPVSWGGMGVWAALAGLGLVCTALAYVVFFRLIADIGPVKSLTVTFLIPPFGVLWGAIFLGEQITSAHLIGGILIAIALGLVLRRQS
ncbi:drug/metabolite transporter (DMT)-like permease [Oxalobacteraceae bacterium GrIS 2.11]